MGDPNDTWNERTSELYREIAPVAVPAREEIWATMLALLPFGREDAFRALDLGCGHGALAAALLECYPQSSVTALDGSKAMLGHARALLESYGPRAEVAPFRLETREWFDRMDGKGCLLSSMCFHHLTAPDKRRVMKEARHRLADGGAFLIGDLLEPMRGEATRLYADHYDRIVREQSQERTGSDRLWERFRDTGWNHFRYPDEEDRPEPLPHLLEWLGEAGFSGADCFWLKAGHAVYGAYLGESTAEGEAVSFDEALEAVHSALARMPGMDPP